MANWKETPVWDSMANRRARMDATWEQARKQAGNVLGRKERALQNGVAAKIKESRR